MVSHDLHASVMVVQVVWHSTLHMCRKIPHRLEYPLTCLARKSGLLLVANMSLLPDGQRAP